MTDKMTQKMMQMVAQVSFDDLPAATVHKAKMHLLDTLGAALAGSQSDEVRKALCLANSSGDSPLWGHDWLVTPRDAALINGIGAHAYELDDCGGCDHSGAVVVPAILALIPTLAHSLSGEKFLHAMVMGYEVARRVLEACGGYEAHNGLGWHSTGTCGVFGAAVAAGLALGLEDGGLVSALGLAGSCAAGTWNFIHDGSQAKKLHSGRAAEGGVLAALMAQAGFQGPVNILEPDCWGSYLSAFGHDQGQSRALIDDFGKNWRLDRCSIKPYATCRGTHSAIDALEHLLTQQSFNKQDIATIEVRMSRFQAGMCASKVITSRAAAQMSLPYALAAKLTYGRVFLEELEEGAYNNQQVKDWLARIDINIDDSMAQEAEPEITIVLADEMRFSATVAHPLGSPLCPLSDEKIIEKFITLSEPVLGKPQIEHLVDTVLTLEKHSCMRNLSSLLLNKGSSS